MAVTIMIQLIDLSRCTVCSSRKHRADERTELKPQLSKKTTHQWLLSRTRVLCQILLRTSETKISITSCSDLALDYHPESAWLYVSI